MELILLISHSYTVDSIVDMFLLCRWTQKKPKHRINKQFCNSVLFYAHFHLFCQSNILILDYSSEIKFNIIIINYADHESWELNKPLTLMYSIRNSILVLLPINNAHNCNRCH